MIVTTVLALTAGAARLESSVGKVSPATACTPQTGMEMICGPSKVEDLVALDGTR